MGFIEAIVLGVAQGILEWLPISSEGVTFLFGVNFFETITARELIRLSLYLHSGTFLAALIYFRKDVKDLFKKLFNYKKEAKETQALINFYLIAILVSGGVGYLILKLVEGLENLIEPSGKIIILILGALLLVTGVLQLRGKKIGKKKGEEANLVDGILTGISQGLAVLPGLSRSGLTVSTLLLRGFKDDQSLKLSFILSIPIVLVGNIALNTGGFVLTPELFVALLLSFIFGLGSIHILLKLARKIQFGWFVLLFGALVIGSVFI